MDNVKEWISLPVPELLTTTSCRKDWKKESSGSSSHLRADLNAVL